MYVICTDGSEVVFSKVVLKSELDQLNQDAYEATGGNFWWEPGDKENAKLPKAEDYKHL